MSASTESDPQRRLTFCQRGNAVSLEMERHRRFALWQQLTALRPDELTAKFLRDLKIYGGAQGIWVDREVIGNISPDVVRHRRNPPYRRSLSG
jgi:hypothetical protein